MVALACDDVFVCPVVDCEEQVCSVILYVTCNQIWFFYSICLMWYEAPSMAWAICANLFSVRCGSVSSCFLNFDDRQDII